MSPSNGRTNAAMTGEDHRDESQPRGMLLESAPPAQFTREQINQFVAQLEVAFDTLVTEWRVTNTSKGKVNGSLRGQVIPYADQRAYTDRLNALFSPAGTRKYAVHTSANFQRSKDRQITAKVCVTCDLTVFGIGSHSATGEEWADNENALTAAEAQAFKRAAPVLGLAGTSTTSPERGWIWTNASGPRQRQDWRVGLRLMNGDKDYCHIPARTSHHRSKAKTVIRRPRPAGATTQI